jgi:hypothetical protein
MDRPQSESPAVTPLHYHCRACGQQHPMLIEHPWWVCPYCHTRLVPADLDPLPHQQQPQQQSNGSSEKVVDLTERH